MDSIKNIFKQFESIGIADEFIILAFIGAIVAYLMQKQCRIFKSYHNNMTSNFLSYQSDIISLRKAIHNLNTTIIKHDDIVSKQLNETSVQRGMVGEKIDGLEDHLKEIKKQLLFK